MKRALEYDTGEQPLLSGLRAPEKAMRLTTQHNDSVLNERQQRELFRVPRSEFSEHKSEREPEPGPEIGKRAALSGADPYQVLRGRDKRRSEVRLPRNEFTQRQRYRDSQGNVYAPALAGDSLYVSLQRHGIVDELDPEDSRRAAVRKGNARGLPRSKKRSVVDTQGTQGKYYGSALFYVQMKGDGQLHRWPAGDVELVDPNTEQLFTGTVRSSIFRGRSKGGYVVLNDVVEWGRMSNPRDFFGRPSAASAATAASRIDTK